MKNKNYISTINENVKTLNYCEKGRNMLSLEIGRIIYRVNLWQTDRQSLSDITKSTPCQLEVVKKKIKINIKDGVNIKRYRY